LSNQIVGEFSSILAVRLGFLPSLIYLVPPGTAPSVESASQFAWRLSDDDEFKL
jgi:hypothetical protein